jgi:hypothetical protein
MLREQVNEHGGNPGDRRTSLLAYGPIGGCACLEVIPLSNVQNPKNSNRYHFALAGISRYKTAGQRMSLRSCLSGPKARWGAGEACSN